MSSDHLPFAQVSDEAIAQRAYEIWESRGCPHGDGSADWETAKKQLLAEQRPGGGPIRWLIARLRNRAAM
ncbi:DUF2934 domain-containing protein [Bythopirellula polymerisocia]|uniref:DUF2934 domain-containing protein n=1 Tax=Bythopirellula polymerisocia TaxID=2528003 RepID=A0A5C6CM91_9BACT|nr:DUF2934 domain-containing protein [Bythopirellula polymerisocia]TWU25700.1 hypothetical protein Pla144_29100 [Bythopirellula polymerisocia]